MKNAYIEITNVCNLSCSFCPGHNRKKRFMSSAEFERIASELDGKVENIFLHLMGEPLLHPKLDEILAIADKISPSLKITTNGTLLTEALPVLASCKKLKTVAISLHSFEANDEQNEEKRRSLFEDYLSKCFLCGQELADKGKYVVFRLWNLDSDAGKGKNDLNNFILKRLKQHFCSEEWVKTHRGSRIATRIFLEWGELFDWPSENQNKEKSQTKKECLNSFCYGLTSQIGILSDGTVVPCCLDRNGSIALGNILNPDEKAILSPNKSLLENILSSPRALAMKESILHHRLNEPLCQSCSARASFPRKQL